MTVFSIVNFVLCVLCAQTHASQTDTIDPKDNITNNNDFHNIDNYEINIRSIGDNTFEIIATIASRIYKKMIDEDFYDSDECPPVLEMYKIVLRQILEKHVYSGAKYSSFFTIDYELHKIKLNFVVNLEYVKEHMSLILNEYTHESFEQKMDKKILKIEEELIERVSTFQPKTYILEQVKYTKQEDQFMRDFKWDIAHQSERDRFIKLSDKYFINGNKGMTMTDGSGRPVDALMYKLISISKIEPLCLTVSENIAHLYGWIDITDNHNKIKEIIIPISAGINPIIPRIIQYSSDIRIQSQYVIDNGEGFLILNQNKLSIIGSLNNKNSYRGIVGVRAQFTGLDDGSSIISSRKKYVVINTHFLINV